MARFGPEQPRDDLHYVGLRCACGSYGFHLSGWPRVATGPGGFFWRSVARVFREARQPTQIGELRESPYWLPVFARCDACGRESTLLDRAGAPGVLPPERWNEPRESYRCRTCRRGSVELLMGEAGADQRFGPAESELLVRCVSCHRQACVAWSPDRPTEQQARLDQLYGRR